MKHFPICLELERLEKIFREIKGSQKTKQKLEEYNLDQRAPLLGSSARSNYYSSEDETEEFRAR